MNQSESISDTKKSAHALAGRMREWNLLATVPQRSLKVIGYGALKGKSDINPQWRYKAMTEVYGPCGKGWSHRLVSSNVVAGANGESLVFLEVAVRIGDGKEFTGMGGDKVVVKDKHGLRSNDEAFKMAYTDALGTALKYAGVASEIYEGNFDGSKYLPPSSATPEIKEAISDDQLSIINKLILDTGTDEVKFCLAFKCRNVPDLLACRFDVAVKRLKEKLLEAKRT